MDALTRASCNAVTQALSELYFEGDGAGLAACSRDAIDTITLLEKHLHAPRDEMLLALPVPDRHA